MRDIRFAAVQFEHCDGDKTANLARIRDLTRRAAGQGAEVVCFHECSITGYTVLQTLDQRVLESWAEPVPSGPSTRALIEIARESGVVVMAGLVEQAPDGRLFNCYIAVGSNGLLAKHHKLHPFINPHLSPGEGYTVFDLDGVRVGTLDLL